MDTSRLGTGDLIAGASGIALLIVMFLPWYGVDVNIAGFSASESSNAWEALSFIDFLLFLVALVAIGVPLARATGATSPDFRGPLLVLAAGALGVVLVVFRLIDLPTPDVPSIAEDAIDFGRRIGVFLGLLATAGIVIGGLRANAEHLAAGGEAPPREPGPGN